ncbi:hypothetical protein V493_01165 [Pseudogymnoascus sp. VKM F-4281 (FW-2241)]|nr:hypothetical protein V493_01165 [Pseudogymnoascus sp. VKM F-4281 (FW-2241)]
MASKLGVQHQRIKLWVRTSIYPPCHNRDLQPLTQGAPNEEPGIAVQYSNGKSLSIDDVNSSSNERDTASKEKSIVSNEKDKRVESAPLTRNNDSTKDANVARTNHKQCRTNRDKTPEYQNNDIHDRTKGKANSTKDELRTNVSQARDSRTAYSLRKTPKKKVVK